MVIQKAVFVTSLGGFYLGTYPGPCLSRVSCPPYACWSCMWLNAQMPNLTKRFKNIQSFKWELDCSLSLKKKLYLRQTLPLVSEGLGKVIITNMKLELIFSRPLFSSNSIFQFLFYPLAPFLTGFWSPIISCIDVVRGMCETNPSQFDKGKLAGL